jgi:hypothetical protein
MEGKPDHQRERPVPPGLSHLGHGVCVAALLIICQRIFWSGAHHSLADSPACIATYLGTARWEHFGGAEIILNTLLPLNRIYTVFACLHETVTRRSDLHGKAFALHLPRGGRARSRKDDVHAARSI